MASEFPAPSSSQQPFATPQPAPVGPTQAASPPSKQSLKSWWKTFGKPSTKEKEAHGKSPPQQRLSQFSGPILRVLQHSSQDNVPLPVPLPPLSREERMGEDRPTAAESPNSEDPHETIVPRDIWRRQSFLEKWQLEQVLEREREQVREKRSQLQVEVQDKRQRELLFPSEQNTKCALEPEPVEAGSFDPKPVEPEPLQIQHNKLVLFRSGLQISTSRKLPENSAISKIVKRCQSQMTRWEAKISPSSGSPFIAPCNNDSSDALGAGILPTPKPTLFRCVIASMSSSSTVNGGSSTRFLGSLRRRALPMSSIESPTGIFGVPLRQSIAYANVAISLVDSEGKSYIYGYVPIVVAKCGVYLKEKATNVEGIFRLNGSEKRIKELREIFNSPDRYGKGLDWAGYTVHDAANVLRRYLNNLPEPIVPLDLYDQFREPISPFLRDTPSDDGFHLDESFDAEKAIITYQRLITELPPLNRQLLLYILDLLAVFASKSDENRMPASNLSAIFQPCILSHPNHKMEPLQYRISQFVLVFLIENQDHFLIGMRGTAADEQTVQEVQNGGTPPPGTPSTPNKTKNTIVRTASNASAGADSVRKYGGIRRNMSTSSRHSRQSNGAPSPASPALSIGGGVHRSNTAPSKRSPGLAAGRLQKNPGSPSPTGALFAANQQTAPRGLSPVPVSSAQRNASPSSPGKAPGQAGVSSLAPSLNAASTVTSQDRLLPGEHVDIATPTRERTMPFFSRSPTGDSEKKTPNKLRKRRLPDSSNPSAQSSTHSLHGQHASGSPAFDPARATTEIPEHGQLDETPVSNPAVSDATPPLTETPRPEQAGFSLRQEEAQQSDKTLKPHASPTSSLRSHSSFNDPSDVDHHDDSAVTEQREKRSRWRLSRHREPSSSFGNTLTPKKGLGSDTGAGASSSSVGSSARPRKSFTADTVPASSDTLLTGAHPQSSNESSGVGGEEKKGPLGWIKKMREKREDHKEKEAEKERNKSPPASTDRLSSILPGRGKSMDVMREEAPDRPADEPATPQVQQQTDPKP